jgi:hypothetical protein
MPRTSRATPAIGFDRCEWLMLVIPAAAALAFIAIFRDHLSALPAFADNTYDDCCDKVFVEDAGGTKIRIRGSLPPESSAQVNH